MPAAVIAAAARIAARRANLPVSQYPIRCDSIRFAEFDILNRSAMTRRQVLSAAALGLVRSSFALAQQYSGMASRGIAPAPRGKPSGLPFHAKFVNVAAQAGLRAPVIYGNEGHVDYILDAMGCGVAFIDYDNDGWLDVITLTGRRRTGPTPEDATIRLYRNNRDGTFRDVTAQSGLGRSVWAAGITVGDYDNDGFDDVFITCWGQNILFHNNGDGTFTDVTEKAGLDPSRDALRHRLHLDRLRSRRQAGPLRQSLRRFRSGQSSHSRDESHVQSRRGARVLRSRRPSAGAVAACITTTETAPSRMSASARESSAVTPNYPLTAVAADFDGDGWPDIYVACDTTPSLLFRNNRDGTFTERGLESGVALNEDGREQGGMGIGVGDFDTDGYLDIFKTHFSSDTHVLYKNNGNGSFRDATNARRAEGGNALRGLGRRHTGLR